MNGYLITGIILVLLIIYIIYENHYLETTHYTIQSKNIPKAFDGVKMAILADLHNNQFGKDNIKLLDKIYQFNPDYILVAGDMVISNEPDNLEVPFRLLSVLAAKYPVYYGLGNHEQRLLPDENNSHQSYKDYEEGLKKFGVSFLNNNRTYICREGQCISITGLSIGMDFYKKLSQPEMTNEYIQNLVGIPNKKWYNILIAHNPVYFKFYSDWGANLIVSGHLHGGIIRFPKLGGFISPQYKFMPKYDAGMFQMDDSVLLVSRGLGLHTIKLRINNRPELMTFTLKHMD
ncbi:MAG: Metallophos domain-containing protein [Lachnoclostridium sp.]|jgi:uncharacterized protein